MYKFESGFVNVDIPQNRNEVSPWIEAFVNTRKWATEKTK